MRRPWPDAADGLVIAACVIFPLVLAGWCDGPKLPVDAASVAARILAGLATTRLLRRLGASERIAAGGGGAYGAIGLHLHAPAGACLALALLAVARSRAAGAGTFLCAAGGTALAFVAEGGDATGIALLPPGAWAFWRLTSVPGGWDGQAALRLLSGVAAGLVAGAAARLVAPLAPAWLIAAPAASAAFDPFGLLLAAAAALVVVAAGMVAAPRRALDAMFLLWAGLVAARAAGVPLARFLLDIPLTLPDAVFLDRAAPSLVMAVVVAATRAGGGRRRITWPFAAAALAFAATIGPVPEPLFVADGDSRHTLPSPLTAGESITGLIPGDLIHGGAVWRVGIDIGTYQNAADGALALTLCADTTCETGTAPLPGAADNAVLFVALPRPLAVAAGQTLRWRATHVGGKFAVALWLAPAPGGRSLEGPGGAITNMSAHVVLDFAAPHRVFGFLPPR